MHFVPHTQDELTQKNICEGQEYQIEYINKDYFNGEETLEIAQGKAIISDGKIIFIVPDPFGMDRFVEQVRLID